MSLVRSFTRRARAHTRGDESSTSAMPRSCSVRYTPGTINRAKISLPTELISTTNVQALNAPDIRNISGESASSASSSSSSVHSNSNDYFSGLDKGLLAANNSSSGDLSPVTPITPISDNESADFFVSKPVVASTPTPAISGPAPAIPQRAPSHSKKAHVALSRQRSFNRSMSPPPSDLTYPSLKPQTSFYDQATCSAPATVRDTLTIFTSPRSSEPHPFTHELAKVHEVAEEFGSPGLVLDEEEQEMINKGLYKFTVNDYIHAISGGIFEDQLGLNPWI